MLNQVGEREKERAQGYEDKANEHATLYDASLCSVSLCAPAAPGMETTYWSSTVRFVYVGPPSPASHVDGKRYRWFAARCTTCNYKCLYNYVVFVKRDLLTCLFYLVIRIQLFFFAMFFLFVICLADLSANVATPTPQWMTSFSSLSWRHDRRYGGESGVDDRSWVFCGHFGTDRINREAFLFVSSCICVFILLESSVVISTFTNPFSLLRARYQARLLLASEIPNTHKP